MTGVSVHTEALKLQLDILYSSQSWEALPCQVLQDDSQVIRLCFLKDFVNTTHLIYVKVDVIGQSLDFYSVATEPRGAGV